LVLWNDRSDLWSKTPSTKYEAAPNFGLLTGMPHNRFDRIWKYLWSSYQRAERPPDCTSEKYRWMLIDDFVRIFNDHRATNVLVTDRICVDESFS
jgi:hypothetical protein